MDIGSVEVEIDVLRETPELEDLVVNSSTEDQKFNSSKDGFKSVTINAIKGEELNLNPSTEQQNVEGVFTKVKLNPIKTQKLSTVPTTQEQVITGLFDEVTVNAIEGQELNLNPSEEQQNFEGVFLGVNINPIQVEEITTDLDFGTSDAIELAGQEGAYIKKATINKPTNLVPENIKSGETVCGISGTNADTSDADATSDDIVAGKTAYVANEKIRGTYEPLNTSDATATAEDIVEGKVAYANGERLVGRMEMNDNNATMKTTLGPGNNRDFGSNLYKYIETIPANTVAETDLSFCFYACTALIELPFIDTSSTTNMKNICTYCSSMTKVSQIDTSKVTDISYSFNYCSKLVDFPQLNLSNVTIMTNMFDQSPNLSNESLNNILAMVLTATSYTGTKTLKTLGLKSEQATRCATLSNYQAFLDAGWTSGF